MPPHGTLPVGHAATRALHADEPSPLSHPNHEVAPSLSLATTFRAPHPRSEIGEHIAQNGELSIDWQDPPFHVYSRYTQDTRGRAEQVLSSLTNGHALTYASGLTAAHAAMTFYAPKVVAIRRGYMGVHGILKIYCSLHDDVQIIDLDDEYPRIAGKPAAAKASGAQNGDGAGSQVNGNGAHDDGKGGHALKTRGLLVWVETPLNPTGEARDLRHYVEKAHAVGGHVVVDSTFAPPPLQDPFAQGADMVMHSLTKYFGGHSDLLSGCLVVRTKPEWDKLWTHRTFLGLMGGNLESWLLLRSMRTLSLRVERQSRNATVLAQWLQSLTSFGSYDEASFSGVAAGKGHVHVHAQGAESDGRGGGDEAIAGGKLVERVWHTSLQPRRQGDVDVGRQPRKDEGGPNFDPAREQMRGGHAPCFSIRLVSVELAKYLPHATRYFVPATSLGGVESLLEWRKAADESEDPQLVRISVGVEDVADLVSDLRSALHALSRGERVGERPGEWQAREERESLAESERQRRLDVAAAAAERTVEGNGVAA